jgi:hypothetical protein
VSRHDEGGVIANKTGGTIRRSVVTIALLLGALFPAAAQADVGDFLIGDASVSLNRDAASGKRGASFDMNVGAAFLAMGVSGRVWDGAITGWNGREVSSEATAYLGVGLSDLFTIQRGWSRAGARTRIRALIGVGRNFPFPYDQKEPGLFGYGPVITPFMEFGGGKKVFGVGLVIGI